MLDDFCKLMLESLNKELPHYPSLPGLVYSSPHDFVLQHGREYHKPLGKWRHGVMPQQLCFANSVMLAAKLNLRYAEGFALAPHGEVILHAWNADDQNKVFDATWANTGLAYYGVEFSVERADDALWNGDACVLNDENRNYPVFRKKWTGEDYCLTWPPSDRLDFYFGRSMKFPDSVAQFKQSSKLASAHPSA